MLYYPVPSLVFCLRFLTSPSLSPPFFLKVLFDITFEAKFMFAESVAGSFSSNVRFSGDQILQNNYKLTRAASYLRNDDVIIST